MCTYLQQKSDPNCLDGGMVEFANVDMVTTSQNSGLKINFGVARQRMTIAQLRVTMQFVLEWH